MPQVAILCLGIGILCTWLKFYLSSLTSTTALSRIITVGLPILSGLYIIGHLVHVRSHPLIFGPSVISLNVSLSLLEALQMSRAFVPCLEFSSFRHTVCAVVILALYDEL